jgi:hypothetical protein
MRRVSPRTLLAILLAVPVLALPSLAAGATAPAKSATPKSVTAKWNPVVPFIEDDFGRALALAKARRLPVFIEGWAPW